MPDQICLDLSNKEQVYQLIIVALILLDYWFGSTDKVKAASLLELLFPQLRRINSAIEKQVQQQPVQGEKNGTGSSGQ